MIFSLIFHLRDFQKTMREPQKHVVETPQTGRGNPKTWRIRLREPAKRVAVTPKQSVGTPKLGVRLREPAKHFARSPKLAEGTSWNMLWGPLETRYRDSHKQLTTFWFILLAITESYQITKLDITRGGRGGRGKGREGGSKSAFSDPSWKALWDTLAVPKPFWGLPPTGEFGGKVMCNRHHWLWVVLL